MSTADEARRIEQSNDIAATVIEVAAVRMPDLFVTLDLRYGIADLLWDKGYRTPVAAPKRCTCGWGGQHDPDNPRCDVAAPSDTDLRLRQFHGDGVWRDEAGGIWVRQSELVEAVELATSHPVQVEVTDDMVERGLKVSREFPMKRGLDNAYNVMRAVLVAALGGGDQ